MVEIHYETPVFDNQHKIHAKVRAWSMVGALKQLNRLIESVQRAEDRVCPDCGKVHDAV